MFNHGAFISGLMAFTLIVTVGPGCRSAFGSDTEGPAPNARRSERAHALTFESNKPAERDNGGAFGSPTEQLLQRAALLLATFDATEAFDVAGVARFALADHWYTITAQKQNEFVQLFADFLVRVCARAGASFSGGSADIEYVGESVFGDLADVRMRLRGRDGQPIPIVARMRRHGQQWLVYDVVVDRVSFIRNFRSQVDAVIKRSSYAEVVRRLQEVVTRLQAKQRGCPKCPYLSPASR